MRASGDSGYVFATATFTRPVDSKQTANRVQSCGRVSFMRSEKASARAIDRLVKSGLRIKIDSALRREYLDKMLFWTAADLEAKLLGFRHYYNAHRTHTGLNGRTPEPGLDTAGSSVILSSYRIAITLERQRSVLSDLAARFQLTDREIEAVQHLADGLTSKEIAQQMNISPNTVKVFLRHIMLKMSVTNRSGVMGKLISGLYLGDQ